MASLREWLDDLGLARYAEVFESEQVELADLADLSDAELKDLGLPLGPRKRLQRAAAGLRDTAPQHAVSTPRADPSPGGERRQITVMFCDLVGSSELSTKLDPEDYRILIQAYHAACDSVAKRYDGYVAEYLGDGVVIYFGWPRAHEDDAERAIRAGLEMIEAVKTVTGSPKPLQVHIGVATGPVVVGGGATSELLRPSVAVGETPNLAARLQGLAEPDQILVGPLTYRLVGSVFETEALGERRLKGFDQPISVTRIVGIGSADNRFEAHTHHLTPLVGREGEMALIIERWERATTGEGQVIVLGGEPGIGKSRTTRALRDRAGTTAHTQLFYQCSPYHTNSALYPVIDQVERAAGFERGDTTLRKLDKIEALLAQSTDNVTDAAPLYAAMLSLEANGRYNALTLSPQEQKQAILAALVAHVTALAARQPVMMTFEDVHWIDPTTQEFLDLFVPQAAAQAVLLVITHRPEYEPPWLGQNHVVPIALKRLGRAQAAALVNGVTAGESLPPELLDQIIARTDGVPLFVEELTKTVLESGVAIDAPSRPGLAIPSTLQDSLVARLDRLSQVKDVAQIGACLGREFAYDLLFAVSSMDEHRLDRALQQLIDSELLFCVGAPPTATYTFKHALVQDAAYETLLRSRRRELHGRIADALESQFAKRIETEPELLAQHLSEAGRSGRASMYWEIAGTRAAARFAHQEAVKHFERGIETAAQICDPEERSGKELAMLVGMAGSFRILSRNEDALAVLSRAQSLADEVRQKRKLAEIHYLKGCIYFPLGEAERSRSEQELALKYAVETGSSEYEARALSGLADASYVQGKMATAFTNFDRCIEVCRSHGFEDIEIANLPLRGHTSCYRGDLVAGRADCLGAVEGAARVGLGREEIIARVASSNVLWELGEFAESRNQCHAGLALARRMGARHFEAYFPVILARIAAEHGRYDEAMQAARHAAEIAGEVARGFCGPWSLGNLARITANVDERKDALAKGEAMLKEKCVSHNYFWFHRDAMDASLRWADWTEAERFAAALEAYTAPEPVFWSDFFIARARALVAHARDPLNAETRQELARLHHEAESRHFAVAKRTLAEALATD